MNPCLCAQTRRAARLLTRLYDSKLAPVSLSAAQFELLTLLRGGERNGRGIANALALDTTTVSRNVGHLLAAGLVGSRQDEGDARQLRYFLTKAGRDRLHKAQALWRAAQLQVTTQLQRSASDVLQELGALGNAAIGKE